MSDEYIRIGVELDQNEIDARLKEVQRQLRNVGDVEFRMDYALMQDQMNDIKEMFAGENIKIGIEVEEFYDDFSGESVHEVIVSVEDTVAKSKIEALQKAMEFEEGVRLEVDDYDAQEKIEFLQEKLKDTGEIVFEVDSSVAKKNVEEINKMFGDDKEVKVEFKPINTPADLLSGKPVKQDYIVTIKNKKEFEEITRPRTATIKLSEGQTLSSLRRINTELSKIEGKGTKAFGTISRSSKGLSDNLKGSIAPSKDIGKAFDGISGAVGNATRLLGGVKGQIASILVSVLGIKTAFEAIQVGLAEFSRMETVDLRFDTLLGSAEKAKKLSDDIMDFSLRTPFEPKELTAATQTLVKYGRAGEEVFEILTRIGDGVASVGGTGADLEQVTGLIERIRAGKFNMIEMEQLERYTSFARKDFAKVLGIDTVSDTWSNELQKMLTDGTISGEVAGQIILDLFALQEGAMDSLSVTLTGLFSTFKGFKDVLSAEMVTDFADSLKAVLIVINDILQKAVETEGLTFLQNLVSKSLIGSLELLLLLVQGLSDGFKPFADIMSKMIGSFNGGLDTASGTTKTLASYVESLKNYFYEMFRLIGNIVGLLSMVLLPIFGELMKVVKLFLDRLSVALFALNAIFSALRGDFTDLKALFVTYTGTVKKHWNDMIEFLIDRVYYLAEASANILSAIPGVGDKLVEKVQDMKKQLLDKVTFDMEGEVTIYDHMAQKRAEGLEGAYKNALQGIQSEVEKTDRVIDASSLSDKYAGKLGGSAADQLKKLTEQINATIKEITSSSRIMSAKMDIALGRLREGSVEYGKTHADNLRNMISVYEQEIQKLNYLHKKYPASEEIASQLAKSLKDLNDAQSKYLEVTVSNLVSVARKNVENGLSSTAKVVADMLKKAAKETNREVAEAMRDAALEFEKERLAVYNNAIRFRREQMERLMEQKYEDQLRPLEKQLDLIKKQKQEVSDRYDEEIKGMKKVLDEQRRGNDTQDLLSELAQAERMLKAYSYATTAEGRRTYAEAEKRIRDIKLELDYKVLEELEAKKDAELDVFDLQERELQKQYDLLRGAFDAMVDAQNRAFKSMETAVLESSAIFQKEFTEAMRVTRDLEKRFNIALPDPSPIFKENVSVLKQLQDIAMKDYRANPALNQEIVTELVNLDNEVTRTTSATMANTEATRQGNLLTGALGVAMASMRETTNTGLSTNASRLQEVTGKVQGGALATVMGLKGVEKATTDGYREIQAMIQKGTEAIPALLGAIAQNTADAKEFLRLIANNTSEQLKKPAPQPTVIKEQSNGSLGGMVLSTALSIATKKTSRLLGI